MAILKQSASELSIHGGGPPAFERKVPLFAPHVGDSAKFASLAARMFSGETEGRIAEEFQAAYADFVDCSNAIGFSSMAAAMAAIIGCVNLEVSLPALGSKFPGIPNSTRTRLFDGGLGACHNFDVKDCLNLRVSHFGFQNRHDEESDWVCQVGHQSIGNIVEGARFGADARLSVVALGRDQVLHGLDAAVVTTNDDILAHRLLNWRSRGEFALNPMISDAAAAMALANLECVDSFVADNRFRFEKYREGLDGICGIRLLEPLHTSGWNHQAVVLDIRHGEYGNSRDSLYHHLAAENIGVGKPFEEDGFLPQFPLAQAARERLIQLPNGPGLDEEAIAAICRVVELASVRGLESPDPLRLAA